jgi:hypothetical protein
MSPVIEDNVFDPYKNPTHLPEMHGVFTNIYLLLKLSNQGNITLLFNNSPIY